MAKWDHSERTLDVKLVYYGPAFGGKTTTLEALHGGRGGELISIDTADGPTLLFDLLPLELEDVCGYRVSLRLYTVPGQVRYDTPRKVVLEGAHSLDEADLRKIIQNSDRYRKTYLGLGKIINPTYYDRAAIDEDRRKMELYYEREGFLDAKVVYVDTTFDAKRKYATLKYRVEEGPRYRVGSFSVTYAEGGEPQERDRKLLDPKILTGLTVLVPGEPFRYEDLSATQREISFRLWDRGRSWLI